MTQPIFTQEHLRNVVAEWLRIPQSTQPGDSRVPLGHPFPSVAQRRSYFVVRVGRRSPTFIKAIQASKPGDRKHVYRRKIWKVTSRHFSVFSVTWSEEPEVTEHTQFPSAAEARRAAKTLAKTIY